MSSLVAWLHAAGWSLYVGGAIVMELVLRHAQGAMHPSQVAVVCQWAGRRYRWWSLGALAVLAVTGALLAAEHGWPGDSAPAYRATVWLLVAIWCLQVGLLIVLALGAHPSMHARAAAGMSLEEARLERERVVGAIRRMDRLLRLELVGATLALVVGSSLHSMDQARDLLPMG